MLLLLDKLLLLKLFAVGKSNVDEIGDGFMFRPDGRLSCSCSDRMSNLSSLLIFDSLMVVCVKFWAVDAATKETAAWAAAEAAAAAAAAAASSSFCKRDAHFGGVNSSSFSKPSSSRIQFQNS